MIRIQKALPNDDMIWNNLISTTQTKTPAGHIVYHPAKRDDDHDIDALRAVIIAIHSLLTESGEEEDTDDGSGWVPIRSSTWRPPWA